MDSAAANVQKRVLYLDYLRILATIGVIVIHVSAQNLGQVPVGSYPWQVFQIANQSVSWAVPMFLMLTGALFLDNRKPLEIGKLYKGNILRILTAFLFWSGIYAVNQLLQTRDLHSAMQGFLKGSYHMWFLNMIVAYYIVTPVFRKITESKKITEYFLIIVFVYIFLIPSCVTFFGYVNIPHTASVLEAVSYGHATGNFAFSKLFVFYFVFGHYLARYDIGPKVRGSVYMLGILGFGLKLLLLNWHALRTGSGENPFDFCINDLAMGAGLFLFAKDTLSKLRLKAPGERILSTLSRYTFGIYLAHVLVLEKFRDWLGLDTLSFDPILSMAVIVTGVAAVSCLISMLLHHVPVLKKYVV